MNNNRCKTSSALAWIALACLLLALPAPGSTALEPDIEQHYRIVLQSRQFVPARGIEPALTREFTAGALSERRHVLLQFTVIPTAAQRAALQEAGVRLLNHVPYYAWFASVPTSLRAGDIDPALLRWMGRVEPADRMAPELRQVALEPAEPLDLEVLFFDDIHPDQALDALYAHQAVVLDDPIRGVRYPVRLDSSRIATLAREDGVLWIAPAPPPKVRDNDGIRARTGVDIVHSAPYGLTGSGVNLGIWDGGVVDAHVDLAARLTIVDPSSLLDDHATHVAGTMAGDGRNSANQGGTAGQWKGAAPGANVFSFDWENSVNEHNYAINVYDIDLSQNSWGYGVSESYGNCWRYGNYDALAADYDAIVAGWYGKRISVVFSAGNERDDGDCNMSPIPPYINYANIGPLHTAKNAIVVGATHSNDDSMTPFSSWGPTDDGRLKPDIVAPGCESVGEMYIHSTLPGNSYGAPGWCGTSMSAPAVSGISALIIEQYRATEGGDPLPSTIRALLIHTAVDLSDDATVYYNPGPDYASGYGRVDARAAADAVRARQTREDQLANGQTNTYALTVPAGSPSLKLTLAWDDPPGTPNAIPALVNNLDLALVAPDGFTTFRPWVLDPANPTHHATQGIDGINNVEQVQVDNPAAGVWQVRVSGALVPQGPQLYSLVSSVSDGCAPPATPDLLGPLDNAVTCNLFPTFSWSRVDGAEGYRIQASRDPSFDTLALDQTVSDTFYTAADPLPAGVYYWRVRAYDGCGGGEWSEISSLTLVPTPLAPALVSPADNVSTRDRAPEFLWEHVSGAVRYLVQVDDDADFSSPLVDAEIMTTSFTPADELEIGVYYWRVRAFGPCDMGPWPPARTVTITQVWNNYRYLPIILGSTS